MSLPTLYTLAEEYRAAAEALVDLDMPPEVVSDTLEGLSGQLQHKAANVAMVVRNLEATAEAIEAAEKTMRERRNAINARATWLRAYLLDNMQRTGIQRIDSPWFAMVVRDNPAAVVVDDAAVIPAEFMRQPAPPPAEPDRRAIADAIKAGREVPGAHLEKSQRMQIK